jgi:hypothetical protein
MSYNQTHQQKVQLGALLSLLSLSLLFFSSHLLLFPALSPQATTTDDAKKIMVSRMFSNGFISTCTICSNLSAIQKFLQFERIFFLVVALVRVVPWGRQEDEEDRATGSILACLVLGHSYVVICKLGEG